MTVIKMTEEEILQIAYNYYPLNVDSIIEKESYVRSKQHKTLLNRIDRHKRRYSEDTITLMEELKILAGTEFVFDDITNFEWQDRCYTFEFAKCIDKDIFVILKFYKSIIAPFFTIAYFKSQNIENANRFFRISKKEFQHSNFIFATCDVAKKHSLIELTSEFSKKSISGINFDDIQMEQFTFFNVFFNSENF